MTDASLAFVAQIRRAIRTGTFVPAERDGIVALCRLATGHASQDYEATDLFMGLAFAVQIDRAPKAGEALEIGTTAWAMLSSPLGLSSPLIAGLPRQDPTVADVLAAAEARVAADQAERSRAQVENPAEILGALVKTAADEHPRLGLSFGYLGNCGIGYDDRSFKIFAKLATPRCHGACDVSFGGHGPDRLGDLLVAVERRLPAWLVEQERRLDAGEIRIVR